MSVVGTHRGAAGHVRITFPRGVMLLSCGHRVELVTLDATAERLVQEAEQVYGAEGSQKMARALADAAPEQRAQLVQNDAKRFVDQSSPARYSEKQ